MEFGAHSNNPPPPPPSPPPSALPGQILVGCRVNIWPEKYWSKTPIIVKVRRRGAGQFVEVAVSVSVVITSLFWLAVVTRNTLPGWAAAAPKLRWR